MVFLGLFELGSLLSGVATSSKMFIVGRAVAGMGGSGIVNGALTIIAKIIPMEKRGSMTPFFVLAESESLLIKLCLKCT
jgi:predicted MFS family arabinose efflux permease